MGTSLISGATLSLFLYKGEMRSSFHSSGVRSSEGYTKLNETKRGGPEVRPDSGHPSVYVVTDRSGVEGRLVPIPSQKDPFMRHSTIGSLFIRRGFEVEVIGLILGP